tara:strand:+ start:323 stop:628 length:306 start_codon:yes stop_codon:yes gene_type:complete
MTRIAVIGLAKSGTTGLWSRLVNTYPRKYLRFFEGDFLQTRYNKYLGRQKPSKNAANIISVKIKKSQNNSNALSEVDHLDSGKTGLPKKTLNTMGIYLIRF